MTKVIETHHELDELLKEFKTETVAEEALRILESIPEDMWWEGSYDNWQCDGSKHCAVGWLGHKKGVNLACAVPNLAVLYSASKYFYALKGETSGIANVNDGKDSRYQQPTAKQRVIALLHDMIKAGY